MRAAKVGCVVLHSTAHTTGPQPAACRSTTASRRTLICAQCTTSLLLLGLLLTRLRHDTHRPWHLYVLAKTVRLDVPPNTVIKLP